MSCLVVGRCYLLSFAFGRVTDFAKFRPGVAWCAKGGPTVVRFAAVCLLSVATGGLMSLALWPATHNGDRHSCHTRHIARTGRCHVG